VVLSLQKKKKSDESRKDEKGNVTCRLSIEGDVRGGEKKGKGGAIIKIIPQISLGGGQKRGENWGGEK